MPILVKLIQIFHGTELDFANALHQTIPFLRFCKHWLEKEFTGSVRHNLGSDRCVIRSDAAKL